ncbi:YhgE/Pip domain-containing protein [Sporolactobacillus pectinivorans]|uniref:YhgE/Pip domain-containing protein n=1 Tax=Sporolactobacillus pectinivorans TaxID=1591408 RepID=UPI000C25E89F|nr:YhgE/Pip domain-containing protein [Sporolactobacillus pectinivorans]
MNFIHLIVAELKAIVSKPHNIVVMVAVMCVPLLYAGMFLYSFWDAFGKTGNLPVAVVNQDSGAEIAGKQINAGSDLVKNLRKNTDFKWQFVSEKEAQDGFKNNHYFMTVRIPASFSKNATTLMDQQLKPANIDYRINADYNFISSRMADMGLLQLKERVSNEITKTYAQSMYAQINKLTGGLKDAANGSKTLASGSKKEVDGLNTLKSGFKDMMNGTNKLAGGSGKLASGASSLNDGLKQAADGTNQLYSQTSSNSGNVAQLADGASNLADKLDQLNKGAAQLASGSGQLTGGSKSLTTGMNQYLAGLNQFEKGMQREKDGLDQLNKQLAASKPQIDALVKGVAQLNTGADQLASGISTLAPYAHQVSDGVNNLASVAEQLPSSDQINQLKQGSSNLKESINQIITAEENGITVPNSSLDALKQGAAALDSNIQGITVPSINPTDISQLVNGASEIDKAFNNGINGNPSLVDASASLSSGLNTLNGNMTTFSSQNEQLSAGVAQLTTGVDQLNSGQQALQSNFIKLVDGEARLSGGMATLQTNLAKVPGATKALGNGAGQLAAGNSQLNQTWPQLVNGIQSLQSGTNQLVSGGNQLATNMDTLNNGLSSLSNGQKQLSNGTNQLTAGAQKIYDGNTKLGSSLSDAHSQLAKTPTNNAHATKFSQPVTTIDGSHQSVNTFGSGFAPYFISLGLYVGALLLTIIYDLGKPAGVATGGWNIALSKFFITILMSIGQALLIDVVVLMALGLHVNNSVVFIGFTILTSMSFMAIIQWLAGSFNNEGRFACIVILIFQLVTSGGAYAIELIPKWLQSVSHVLPMTYSVNGFRNIIDGHQHQMFVQNTTALVVFVLVGLALSIITFSIKFYLNQDKTRSMNHTSESSVES